MDVPGDGLSRRSARLVDFRRVQPLPVGLLPVRRIVRRLLVIVVGALVVGALAMRLMHLQEQDQVLQE